MEQMLREFYTQPIYRGNRARFARRARQIEIEILEWYRAHDLKRGM